MESNPDPHQFVPPNFIRFTNIRQDAGGLYFDVMDRGLGVSDKQRLFRVYVREVADEGLSPSISYEFTLPDWLVAGWKRATSPRLIKAPSMNAALKDQMDFLNRLVRTKS